MKTIIRKTLACIFALLFALGLNAQDKDGVWRKFTHIRDADTIHYNKPEYELYLTDDLYDVKLGNFNDGRALIQTWKDGMFFINKKGEVIFKLKEGTTERNYEFSSGLVGIPEDGILVLYDRNGNEVKKFGKEVYNMAGKFVDGIAAVHCTTEPEYRYIDTKGNFVFPNLWTNTFEQNGVRPTHDGLTAFPFQDEKTWETLWGFRDDKGKIVIQPTYWQVGDFHEGLAAVCVNKDNKALWGFIDLNGNMVIPAQYEVRPKDFSNGYSVIKFNDGSYIDKTCFIDREGRTVTNAYLDSIYGKSDKRVNINEVWNVSSFNNDCIALVFSDENSKYLHSGHILHTYEDPNIFELDCSLFIIDEEFNKIGLLVCDVGIFGYNLTEDGQDNPYNIQIIYDDDGFIVNTDFPYFYIYLNNDLEIVCNGLDGKPFSDDVAPTKAFIEDRKSGKRVDGYIDREGKMVLGIKKADGEVTLIETHGKGEEEPLAAGGGGSMHTPTIGQISHSSKPADKEPITDIAPDTIPSTPPLPAPVKEIDMSKITLEIEPFVDKEGEIYYNQWHLDSAFVAHNNLKLPLKKATINSSTMVFDIPAKPYLGSFLSYPQKSLDREKGFLRPNLPIKYIGIPSEVDVPMTGYVNDSTMGVMGNPFGIIRLKVFDIPREMKQLVFTSQPDPEDETETTLPLAGNYKVFVNSEDMAKYPARITDAQSDKVTIDLEELKDREEVDLYLPVAPGVYPRIMFETIDRYNHDVFRIPFDSVVVKRSEITDLTDVNLHKDFWSGDQPVKKKDKGCYVNPKDRPKIEIDGENYQVVHDPFFTLKLNAHGSILKITRLNITNYFISHSQVKDEEICSLNENIDESDISNYTLTLRPGRNTIRVYAVLLDACSRRRYSSATLTVTYKPDVLTGDFYCDDFPMLTGCVETDDDELFNDTYKGAWAGFQYVEIGSGQSKLEWRPFIPASTNALLEEGPCFALDFLKLENDTTEEIVIVRPAEYEYLAMIKNGELQYRGEPKKVTTRIVQNTTGYFDKESLVAHFSGKINDEVTNGLSPDCISSLMSNEHGFFYLVVPRNDVEKYRDLKLWELKPSQLDKFNKAVCDSLSQEFSASVHLKIGFDQAVLFWSYLKKGRYIFISEKVKGFLAEGDPIDRNVYLEFFPDLEVDMVHTHMKLMDYAAKHPNSMEITPISRIMNELDKKYPKSFNDKYREFVDEEIVGELIPFTTTKNINYDIVAPVEIIEYYAANEANTNKKYKPIEEDYSTHSDVIWPFFLPDHLIVASLMCKTFNERFICRTTIDVKPGEQVNEICVQLTGPSGKVMNSIYRFDKPITGRHEVEFIIHSCGLPDISRNVYGIEFATRNDIEADKFKYGNLLIHLYHSILVNDFPEYFDVEESISDFVGNWPHINLNYKQP